MDKPAAWVAFHADGAWSITCTNEDSDLTGPNDEAVVGWTSL